MRSGRRWGAGVAAAVALAAGCATADGEVPGAGGTPAPGGTTSSPATAAASPSGRSASPVATSPAARPRPEGPVAARRFETLATGLDVPWGLAFLPDGSALVSERDTARVVRVTPGGRVLRVGEVTGVVPGGEGGLMGLAFGPDADRGPFVYAYLTAARDNRVVRMRWTGGSLGEPEVIVDGIPKASNHNGGRIVFGPDGMLYVATGDASQRERAQDRDSLGGKILRVRPDGSVPPGNPFPRSPVWSLGHRNVQGLAFDDRGRLWAGEFGQNSWDELNLVEAGQNYGWPEVEGEGGGERYVDPVAQWSTDEASPSGVAWLRDTVFLAALRGERLWQVPVPGGRAGQPRAAAVGDFGRLRTVEPAPDGSLWVTTSNTDGRGVPRRGDDRVLRVEVGPA